MPVSWQIDQRGPQTGSSASECRFGELGRLIPSTQPPEAAHLILTAYKLPGSGDRNVGEAVLTAPELTRDEVGQPPVVDANPEVLAEVIVFGARPGMNEGHVVIEL